MSPSSPPPAVHRAHGLDTLRAVAIILVFMYHYMLYVSHQPTFGWLSVVGWAGVDLFFVLSGYLIANQVFAGLARGERFSLGAFYARRALRTLPNYWVVLAFYFLFPAMVEGTAPPPLWKFLTFTQNFGLEAGSAFSHAWSLCVEEQFYLVLPLVVVAALRVGKGRGQAWLLMASLLTVGVTARALLWQTHGPASAVDIRGYFANIYFSTLCRFDEFLPGIALAYLKSFHPARWEQLLKRGQVLLLAGLAASSLLIWAIYRFYFIKGVGYTFSMTAFGYSLLALAFGLLVAAALSPSSFLYRLRIPGAEALALWSYAIYLSHKPIAYIVRQLLKPIEMTSATEAAIIIVVCLAGGFLLYRLVETPFMHLRQRLFPSNFPWAPPRATRAPC